MVANHLIIFSKVDRIKHHKRGIELSMSTNITTIPGTEYNRQADKQNEQHSSSASTLKNEIGNQIIF